MDIINIYENYNSYFNDDLKSLFETLSKSATKHGFKIYLVGGIVRDMLLKRESHDIDITVEGDAIKFAGKLKSDLDAKICSIHDNFGTAKIKINEINIDLASTRSESYPKKGHLPHIDEIGCSLEKDVLRRDFTINSLALSLNQDSFANIIDFVDGLEDLKAKKIKVLHNKSFVDDPTRIIRALKYSSRLKFKIDKKTIKLQEEYLANINYDMCYKRVKQEIQKTFDQNIQEAFDEFLNQGIYKLISRHAEIVSTPIHLPNFKIKIIELINIYPPKHIWLVYFGVLSMSIDIKNIPLTKYEKEVIEGAKSFLEKPLADDFEIYKAFGAQKLETLLILAANGKKKEVVHYLEKLKKIKLGINGKTLLNLGIKPSKKFSEVFDYVLKEKLKNPYMEKEEELNLAKEFLLV